MRRLVIAFAVGAAVLLLVEIVAVIGLDVIAAAYGWQGFELRAGPVLFAEYERGPRVSTMAAGPGLALVALVAGTFNAAGAAVLQRRV